MALAVSGLTRANWLPDAAARRAQLVRDLRGRRTSGGWGYQFDVQTRWGFYPADSPNAVVTAFVVEAIAEDLGAAERSEIVHWLTHEMWAGTHFRYVPGNDALVHNASMLCARALARLHAGHPLIQEAIATCTTSLTARRLWPYGESRGLEWVDNFHTAYVIDCLVDLEQEYPEVSPVLDLAVERYFADCFTDDGTPLYFARRSGPVDMHNIATALYLTQKLRDSGRGVPRLSENCLAYALKFQRADGAFVTSSRAIPFMRWNQAHMYLALSETAASDAG